MNKNGRIKIDNEHLPLSFDGYTLVLSYLNTVTNEKIIFTNKSIWQFRNPEKSKISDQIPQYMLLLLYNVLLLYLTVFLIV